MILSVYGGDVKDMTNDSKKIPFTFRIKEDLNDRIEKEAKALGITKTAYITMTLNKTMNQEK